MDIGHWVQATLGVVVGVGLGFLVLVIKHVVTGA